MKTTYEDLEKLVITFADLLNDVYVTFGKEDAAEALDEIVKRVKNKTWNGG